MKWPIQHIDDPEDYEYNISDESDFEDIPFGTDDEMWIDCESCNATGEGAYSGSVCKSCKGSGVIKRKF